MKPIKHKKLESLEIELNERGFTVYINEVREGRQIKYCLLDGSMLKDDGKIRMGKPMGYKYEAVYDWDEFCIKLVKRSKWEREKNKSI